MTRRTPEESITYRTGKVEKIIIGLILLGSGLAIFWFKAAVRPDSALAKQALVYRENKLLRQIDLRQDRVIDVLDGKMQLEVKAGKIRVLQADCPHKVCMNMGWIQYSGQTIVCTPNRVLLEIKTHAPAFLDGEAY